MNLNKVVISGTGCALADFLYSNINFSSELFSRYMSDKEGDGGLFPGKLVFIEELEKFSGINYPEIIREIAGLREPDFFNVGGPSLVSLIHVSQMLDSEKCKVNYYGARGNDEIAGKIIKILENTTLNIENYIILDNSSPFTLVFSDPAYDKGSGERIFVNNLGAAEDFTIQFLDDNFFNSDIICFGGTALVPQIHDNLTFLLKKAKKNNALTIVNTVYDFRSEKENPGKPWSLVNSFVDYEYIDVLLMDCEEAIKISGEKSIEGAAYYFSSSGVSSFIITNGVNNIFAWSGGRIFKKMEITQFPISKKVTDELKKRPDLKGDTTGCGDNFAGGIIASVAMQTRLKRIGQFNMLEAISWGIASGGYTCYILGGVFVERFVGEKRLNIMRLSDEYLRQIKRE